MCGHKHVKHGADKRQSLTDHLLRNLIIVFDFLYYKDMITKTILKSEHLS